MISFDTASSNATHISEAVISTLGGIETDVILNSEPPVSFISQNEIRHRQLENVLTGIDYAVILEETDSLVRSILGQEYFSEFVRAQDNPPSQENIYIIIYNALHNFPENAARKALEETAPKYRFRYDPNSDPKFELEELMDFAMNAILVRQAMRSLKVMQDKNEIGAQDALFITDLILRLHGLPVNQVITEAVQKQIQAFSSADVKDPIIYLALGCGYGEHDKERYNELKEQFPQLDLRLAGFDPFFDKQDHIFTKEGHIFIDADLKPGETFPHAILKEAGLQKAYFIAVERYALHHMGRSLAGIQRELGGIPFVSGEEPVRSSQRKNMFERAATVAYDLLANWCFDTQFKQKWTREAIADPDKNYSSFNALYRREETLHSNGSIQTIQAPGVWPRTDAITYNDIATQAPAPKLVIAARPS